jgi:NitT/TauT family transport system substrate-binding protein
MEVKVRSVGRFVVVLLGLLVVGCTPAAATPPPLTELSVGLGYIPSVQFAQFYRAQQQGYYRDAGLEVTFQNEIDPNLVTLVGQGAVDIGMGDGTSVIPAVGQGVPIRYAATIFARFPGVVFAAADSGIGEAADLAGRTVGTPGRFGTNWIMLQALLASAGLTVDDIEVRDYPDFGQAVGLRQGQVDAATGFRNNEPVQLARQGFATNVLTVDEITPLAGPGLIVGVSTLAAKRDALRAFVAATMRAMEEISANPQAGLDDAIAVVPELASDREGQLAVLVATAEMWANPYTQQHGMGAVDAAAWQASLEFMRGLPDSNIPAELTVDDLITQELISE